MKNTTIQKVGGKQSEQQQIRQTVDDFKFSNSGFFACRAQIRKSDNENWNEFDGARNNQWGREGS